MPEQVIALIPARASDAVQEDLADIPLLQHTLQAARSASRIERTFVTTDAPEVRELALRLGAEAPFLRPPELSRAGVPLEDVLRHALTQLRQHERLSPAAVVLLEASHPFRPPGVLDALTRALFEQDLDTVFCVAEERDPFWSVDGQGNLHQVGHTDRDTRSTRRPVYRELAGLGLITRSEFMERGERLGKRVGVLPIPLRYDLVDTQRPDGLEIARRLASLYAEGPT